MIESAPVADVNTTALVRRRVSWLILTLVVVAAILGIWSKYSAPENNYRRGREALIAGDRKVVTHEAELLLSTPGYESHGNLLKGLFLLRVGKLDEAIPFLEKAGGNKDLMVEANTAASRCYCSSGRFLEAIDAAQAALTVDATCLDARRWLAAAYYDLGANSHAVAELERVARDRVARVADRRAGPVERRHGRADHRRRPDDEARGHLVLVDGEAEGRRRRGRRSFPFLWAQILCPLRTTFTFRKIVLRKILSHTVLEELA